MKNKTTLRVVRIVSIIFIMLAILMTAQIIRNKRKESITIGTGGTKGMYYRYSQQIADMEKNAMNIRVRETDGSLANLRLIQDGYLDVAIVQSDTLYDDINTIGAFKDKPMKGERSFSASTYLYTEAVQIIVRKDSDINSVLDLKGKKVSIGEKESGVIINAEDILSIYGLELKDIEASYLNFEESANALENGTIDAFFITAGAPTMAISELVEKDSIRFLSIEDEDASRVLSLNPGYVKVTIPAGTYKGQDEEVKTVGVHAIVVMSNRLDEDIAYKITKDILENSEKMNESVATDDKISPEEVPDKVIIPFHKGAAKYYKEKGVTVVTDEGN